PGDGDFTIAASPTSQSLVAGNSTTYTITIGALSGFSGNVALSASGLPAGATASLNPSSITASGSSTLTVTTSVSTTPGSYNLTVTGSGSGLSHTTSVSLTVNPAPDFSVSASPTSQTVITGNSASYSVTVGSANGFNNPVSLSVS